MNRRQMTWPEACALIFAGVPALVFLVAVLCVYPVPVLCFSAGIGFFVLGERAGRRRAALAARAAVDFPRNLAIVAAPLPDARTVPFRQVRR